MDDWIRRADEEMARRHPRRWAPPREAAKPPVMPAETDLPRREAETADPHLDRVRATISWLVAYYAQETDERRCAMGTGYSGLPGAVGPVRKPARR